MALQYRTEYCLGRRGQVCRTYGGIQALIAIAFDILLGLTFGLVGLGIGLARFLVVMTLHAALALVTLPWKVSRHVAARPAPKPTWAGFSEL